MISKSLINLSRAQSRDQATTDNVVVAQFIGQERNTDVVAQFIGQDNGGLINLSRAQSRDQAATRAAIYEVDRK